MVVSDLESQIEIADASLGGLLKLKSRSSKIIVSLPDKIKLTEQEKASAI